MGAHINSCQTAIFFFIYLVSGKSFKQKYAMTVFRPIIFVGWICEHFINICYLLPRLQLMDRYKEIGSQDEVHQLLGTGELHSLHTGLKGVWALNYPDFEPSRWIEGKNWKNWESSCKLLKG